MRIHSRKWWLLALLICFTFNSSALRAQEEEEKKEEKSAEKKEEKWDVSKPPGEWHEVPIDVDEGTWMSLDVSPDGSEIVFDLLGDIYALPIGGGEARALTSGIAWDMQPRYSPDGSKIAFTSDRGGGDNIWTMNRDGSEPAQVSSETFRLLNSPAWSPDGQFIAARKHFTSSRSLGAGEIWLYHVSGGSGLQLTKRPNDQKDVGEPVFSPDGKYVYFSQDTTPGSSFEYNKDPNGQIYQVRRLERESGRIENLTGGSGGAVRPTPSPDGKYLAFVRRVHYRTTLFLRDLASGAEWQIYQDLERDMQETWAVHGVYPTIAWTPDNQSIIFWARGKIRRISVSSGETEIIPFRVKDARSIHPVDEFEVDVAAESFRPKMLRWVQVSPQGDRALFQALGHIYIRDLPDGAPRRLTSQNDHFEFYPSFSRDGQSVVYTSWDDLQLSRLRVAPAGGAAQGRVLTQQPGYYLQGTFSPDGQRIVFRKSGGGGVTAPYWSEDDGLYWISSQGGEMHLISREGIQPHFGGGSDRVFYTAFSSGKRVLKSIELDGSDDREHASSENATEFRVSPDGRWLAFVERFHAYITPFVASGQAVALSPKSKSMPISRVSRDAGEYLHWSGDSQTLHWALGPELFSRNLNEAFKFIAGAPDELPQPAEAGVDLSFDVASDVPTGSVAFVGGRVITMEGDRVIEDGTVIVEGNRIVAVGPRGEVTVPAGSFVVDAQGKTLMPGLIDVHAHGPQGSSELVPQRNWAHFAGLTFGVTTVHDPSNDTSTIFAASEMARAGRVTAPRIFSTGTILYGATTPITAEVNNLEDARSHLRRMKAVGAFSVKSYNQPRRDQRQQILAAARELKMMVVPEGGSLYQHNMTMVVDGHHGIEHSVPVERMYDDVIQLWSQTEVGYTPTLVVSYGGLWGENYFYQKSNVWENERLRRFLPTRRLEPRSRRRTMVPEDEFNHFNIAAGAHQLGQAGVSVQVGAHGQREGLGAHWEMWMFEQGGMSPMEALRTGTLDAAAYIGMDRELGSIEPGKLADILVLDKNPLDNLRDSVEIRYTMINGRLFDAATMNQTGNHPDERGALYFEVDPRTIGQP